MGSENERGDDSTTPLAASPSAIAITSTTCVNRQGRHVSVESRTLPGAVTSRAQVPTNSTAKRTCPRPDHRCTSLMEVEYPEVSAPRRFG